jgi:hypothetical protein
MPLVLRLKFYCQSGKPEVNNDNCESEKPSYLPSMR